MTTNTNAALISHLQALGDRAYCDYIAKMKTNECLGWEEKVRTKKFGQAELTAHTKAGELLGKHRAFAEAVAALTTAAAVPAEGVVMVPVELANRVQESLGEFLMDHGWSQRDMDTSDDFGAVLLAAAPKAEPVPAGEREELREGASYESMNLAAMVLSDCGHSSNYQPLLERVAGRIDRHVERLLTVQQADRAMRAQAAPQQGALGTWSPASGAVRKDADGFAVQGFQIFAEDLRSMLGTSPQPSPVAQGDALTYEQSYTIRQGHEIASSDAYFEAQPQIDNNDRRGVFRAGFERGWDAARSQAKEGA